MQNATPSNDLASPPPEGGAKTSSFLDPVWGYIRYTIELVPAARFLLPIGLAGIIIGLVAKFCGFSVNGTDVALATSVVLLGMIFVFVLSGIVDPLTPVPGNKALTLFLGWAASILIVAASIFALYALAKPLVWPHPPIPSAPERVVGAGPTFTPPMFASRVVDACIDSERFSGFNHEQCISSAQQVIANAFCYDAGYRYAKDDFETKQGVNFLHAYKYQETSSDSGTIGHWDSSNFGGAQFTKITCLR